MQSILLFYSLSSIDHILSVKQQATLKKVKSVFLGEIQLSVNIKYFNL